MIVCLYFRYNVCGMRLLEEWPWSLGKDKGHDQVPGQVLQDPPGKVHWAVGEVRSLSLHLRCCYGLTLCTSCFIYQLATRATLDNKDIICYKEKRLVRCGWQAWGGEGSIWLTTQAGGHQWDQWAMVEQWKCLKMQWVKTLFMTNLTFCLHP